MCVFVSACVVCHMCVGWINEWHMNCMRINEWHMNCMRIPNLLVTTYVRHEKYTHLKERELCLRSVSLDIYVQAYRREEVLGSSYVNFLSFWGTPLELLLTLGRSSRKQSLVI